MKKIILSALAASIVSGVAHAQLIETDNVRKSLIVEAKDTVCWLHSGILTLGVNQGFLHNWSAGGEIASLTIDGLVSGNITRLYHRHIWSNSLDANYSLFYAYSNHFVPKKVDDRIDFTSKYGVRIDTSNFFFTGLLNFKSQFTKGYDYSVPNWDTFSTSKFGAPAYFTLAAGGEYRRGSWLSLFVSPLAARVTTATRYYTDRSAQGMFGIDSGKTARFELGAYFSGRYTHDFSKKVSFKTRLDLYTNYLAKNKKDAVGNIVSHDNPGNIDVLWDNLLSVKISKYFDAVIALTAIYDNDLPYQDTYKDATGADIKKDEPATGLGWWQVKEVFTLGFSYKF